MVWLRLRNRYYLRHLRRKDLPDPIRDYLQGFVNLNLKKPIVEAEFVVFDTETTGLHVKKGDRIVSISAVRMKKGRIDLSDAFHALVNPNRDIPSSSAVVHEILPRMVDGKPTLEKILPEFIRYVGSAVLVAHHAWLDLSFLNDEMTRLFGFPIQNMVVDTAMLDQALVVKKTPLLRGNGTQIDSSLKALAERYQVSLEDQHSSFGDALVTALLFQNMIKQVQRNRALSLKDLLKMASAPSSSDLFNPGMSGT
jgi:DNA polymerase III subunit epsilon